MLLRLPYLAENVNVVVNTCQDWQQSVSTVGMFAILFGFPEFNDSVLKGLFMVCRVSCVVVGVPLGDERW